MEKMDNLMLDQQKAFRVNRDTLKKIDWLLKHRGDIYHNESHLFRCAIIKLYNLENE